MSVSKGPKQVTWAGADYLDIATEAPAQESDAFVFEDDSFTGMITCHADNQGSPTSGDIVDFFLEYTTGDPVGDGADKYDTKEQATHLCSLNTQAPDLVDGIAQRTIEICTAAKGGKIYAVNRSAFRTIRVGVEVYEASA